MTDFQQAFNRVELHLEKKYGIEVSISDVLDPNTGDFDGERIKLDYDQSLEMAFFVLLHLFGHTVQWNISEEFRILGQKTDSQRPVEELDKIYVYERDATRYSLQLLAEVGIEDMDRWVCDWFNADWKFLSHLYKTGERLDVKTLLKPDEGELLTALEVPKFKPQKWLSRWSF